MGLFDMFRKTKYENVEINDEQFGKIIIKHDIDKGVYEGKTENEIDFLGHSLDIYMEQR